MQIIEDPKRNLGAQIGAGLGQGIGQGFQEQFGKQYQQSRLAQGLEELGKNAQNMTPLQQMISAYKIPGFTAEHGYTIMPLLQQEAKRRAGLQRAGGQEQIPGAQPNQQVQPEQKIIAPEKGKEQRKPSLKPKEATEAQLTPIIRKSRDELFNEASVLSNQDPINFPTPQDALPVVEANEATRIQNLQEKRLVGETADTLRTRIQSGLDKFWEKEKTKGQIPGTIQTKLLENVEKDLADPSNRLSEQELIKKWGNIGQDLARQDTLIREKAASDIFSGNKSPSKILNTIQQSRKVFEKAGALEEFQDIIQEQFGLSPEMASYLTYQPSKELSSILNTVKEPSKGSFGVADPKLVTKETYRVADEITQKLNTSEQSTDSLLALARLAKSKGLDPKQFLDRINQNAKAGLIDLNPRQIREITKGIPFFPSIGDIYMSTMLNFEDLAEPDND